MYRHTYVLIALLGFAPLALAGGVTDNPCENVDSLNGSTVTLPNNETVDCAGSTVANPAPAGTNAAVTDPPPPLDPIRDNPGTSVDRIRGTYGDNTGTTGTTGRNNVGNSVGVPDSTGVTRGSSTNRDTTIGVTRDSADTGVGTSSTTNTRGTTSTGTTRIEGSGTVGGTGSVGGTGGTGSGTATGGAQ